MGIYRTWLLLVCVLWASSATAAGQLADMMTKFAQRCGDVAFDDDHPSAIFTDGNYTREWRATDLKELAECETCYDTALVWRTKTASVVLFEQSSETQDWQRRVLYCYDANGRATNALMAFTSQEGWAAVIYYTLRDGAFVATTSTFRNLKTWAAIPEPGSWSVYRAPDGAPEAYVTIGRLPFATLLRRRNPQQ